MNRFDNSWYCQYISSLTISFLRVIPTYRDRLFINWSISSITLVFSITQLILFLNYAVVNWCSVTQVIYLYLLGVITTVCLLTTWLWGIWYFLRLLILYWLKDLLPLWMNASLISSVLVATGLFGFLWNETVMLTGEQLPLYQFHFILIISFGIGALLPMLNNQRLPNKYFA